MTTEDLKTSEKIRTTAKAAKNITVSAVDTAKDQFAKAAETQFKVADDVAAFGKSNLDAFVASGSIFFKGLEELTRSVVGLTHSQVESSMTVAKALISAKTLTEFTDLQNAYAKTAFDSAISEATHLSELAIRITTDAVEPIGARLTATIEQISKQPAFAV